MLLPRIGSQDEIQRTPRDEATYVPAIGEILRMHGMRFDRLSKYPDGSCVVFAADEDRVVKLFEPIFTNDAATEAAVLKHIHGRLGIPTPGVIATGELEGWRYIVMEQMRGAKVSDLWPDLSDAHRHDLCAQVGQALARLHGLPVSNLSLPWPPWTDFLKSQRENAVEQQRRKGLDPHWLEQVEAFLDSVPLPPRPPVLMHTEIMRVHLLATREAGGWKVSGLFDFEPARLGCPEYEFCSVGIFLTGGDKTLFRSFLDGYGLPDPGPELSQRIMACTLLHRYSNLHWFLETIPPRSATTLEALAEEWF